MADEARGLLTVNIIENSKLLGSSVDVAKIELEFWPPYEYTCTGLLVAVSTRRRKRIGCIVDASLDMTLMCLKSLHTGALVRKLA